MSDEMKIACWRIIDHHTQRAAGTTKERRERLLLYKVRLWLWMDKGAIGPMPEPAMVAYRFHWSLYRKIAKEIANHAGGVA
jgi:hypothetical protein